MRTSKKLSFINPAHLYQNGIFSRICHLPTIVLTHQSMACYSNCNNCVFDSDFGTGATNTTQVSIYMAQRIAVFFQAILVGIDQNLVNYEFVECENTRKKCETNPACSNTACDIE